MKVLLEISLVVQKPLKTYMDNLVRCLPLDARLDVTTEQDTQQATIVVYAI